MIEIERVGRSKRWIWLFGIYLTMDHFQSQFQLRSDYEIRQGIKKYGKFNFLKKVPILS